MSLGHIECGWCKVPEHLLSLVILNRGGFCFFLVVNGPLFNLFICSAEI